jgi:hypothetical protein
MSTCADCANHATGVVRRTGSNRQCPVARIALTMLPAWFVERVGIDNVHLRGLR